MKPPIISVALNKKHYTCIGIEENGTFSVNIPSEAMVKQTDYCGMVSGHKVDKSTLFGSFYGELKTAPMIEECPLNLECRVVRPLDFGGMHDVFFGEIVRAYAEEKFLTDGLPDIQKIKPFVFSLTDKNYWKVGGHLGAAWSVGKELRKGAQE